MLRDLLDELIEDLEQAAPAAAVQAITPWLFGELLDVRQLIGHDLLHLAEAIGGAQLLCTTSLARSSATTFDVAMRSCFTRCEMAASETPNSIAACACERPAARKARSASGSSLARVTG